MAFSLLNSLSRRAFQLVLRRQFAKKCKRVDDPCVDSQFHQGLVLGIYVDPDEKDDPGKFTLTAERYNQLVKCKLFDVLQYTGPPPKQGEVRIFYNLEEEFASVALVGLGKECQGYDIFEKIDEGKEVIRTAAAVGCQALQSQNISKISVESFGHAESAAEGAAMGLWLYQDHKHPQNRVNIPPIELHDDCDYTGWQIGLQKAAAQNLARQLSDTPANMMTPTAFAQNAVEVFCKSGINVEVKVRGWIEAQGMNAFLAAAQGSCEPPIFLELSYYGSCKDERPVVLIGKGITYNSGGLCLRECENQKLVRGDLSGAACIAAACRAAAGLQLPLNIRALIPLCENMPGCAAMRPGDIVKAMNGKSICIQSSDTAGRLVLADALVYAQSFWPRFIVDVGNMTSEIEDSMGGGASGVFSNSEVLWEYMVAAAMHTGDRVWRFPLWDCFKTPMLDNPTCDLQTLGKDRKSSAAPSKTAAFLSEFVPCGDWLHLDTHGVRWTDGSMFKYLRSGMSGRPTRTLVEFLSQLVCHRE